LPRTICFTGRAAPERFGFLFAEKEIRKDEPMGRSITAKGLTTTIAALLMLTIWGCGTSGDIHWGRGSRWKNPDSPTVEKGGPPPWAPAHGHRAKHRYLYFPSCSVYYDTDRSTYFYIEDGRWVVSVDLPDDLSVRLGNYVVLEMDTAEPHRYHGEHQRKYPPGQMKKKNNPKWSKF